jgi:hypothetical protein
VQLVASDPEGDPLTFGFSGPAVPDLAATAAITRTPDGQGLFTFTPVASQIGQQVLDLWASDGHHEDHVPLFIEVRQAAGVGTVPVFGSPLGAGTVLDLEQTDCLGLDIEVEDPDSTMLVLDQVPPLIEGASLMAAPDGRTGAWNWCPDRRQIDTSDRYTLRLRADDGDNPPVIKEFVIVLRRGPGDKCPGEAPVIQHVPMDVTTRLDPAIMAEITDDLGLGTQPYLVWATEAPGDPQPGRQRARGHRGADLLPLVRDRRRRRGRLLRPPHRRPGERHAPHHAHGRRRRGGGDLRAVLVRRAVRRRGRPVPAP